MSRDRRLLFVHSRGGAPLEYALPRLAARGEVHILAFKPLPTVSEERWRPHVATVVSLEPREGDDMADVIHEHAQRLGVDAIFTLSEFTVIAVAEAARRLGLRSSGPNSVLARDKRAMRDVWAAAGVPVPRHRPVSSEDDVRRAYAELTPPLLLKSAWSSGSIGQLVLDDEEKIPGAWKSARAAVLKAQSVGAKELSGVVTSGDFLVEEIISGSTRTWWPEGSGYGDYLSVEGIVADGEYHPLCITARTPTIPHFTELSNLCPCPMPEELQRRIEGVARAAVDTLGLETAGTHTELKLMDDGGLCVIEVAARFGGVMVVPEIEHVFGVDAIGMLIDSLLGEPVDFPKAMLTAADARGAAGSLSLISTDSKGTPWERELTWDHEFVDWSSVLSEGTEIETVADMSVEPGTPMPRYDLAKGVTGYGGIFFLRTKDAATLIHDSYSVLDHLEDALAAGQPGTTTA